MLYNLITVLSILTISSFSNLEDADPIVVRHDKEDAEFIKLAEQFKPYLCHLNLPDCEGTIISDEWVVSAAHCSIEIQKMLERGEKHFMIIQGSEIEVEKVIIHENWGENQANDIALIKLKSKPQNAKIAKLYQKTDEENKVIYCIGKGDKGDGNIGINGNDGQLRAATNKIERATNHWLTFKFDDPQKESENLTEYEGISGPGDSGGPGFIIQNEEVYIAGVSSGQDNRATNGVEGLYGVTEYYVRVSQYLDWIEKHMKTN